jgi:hypothetical protein
VGQGFFPPELVTESKELKDQTGYHYSEQVQQEHDLQPGSVVIADCRQAQKGSISRWEHPVLISGIQLVMII